MAAITTTASVETDPKREDDFSPVAHSDILNWKERVALEKKTQFLRNAKKLRNQIDRLEKEKLLTIRNRKNGFSDGFEVLEEYNNRLQLDQKTEIKNIQQQLAKVKNVVKRFQSQLLDMKPTPEFLEKLKEVMTEVELSINAFKEEQRQSYEELFSEERMYWQEIIAIEKKIDAWSIAVAIGPKEPPAPLTKVCLNPALEEERPPEVVELERFLQQNGGPQGGWDQYDHQSFLQVWTRHGGRPPFQKEALLFLPGRTEEEVKGHEEWYRMLLLLQDRKKEAILRWRAERQKEKQARLQEQAEGEEAARRQREEQEEARQRRLEEERQEAAGRLQVWRTQRAEQLAQEAQCRLQEGVRRRRHNQEERRRQLEAKLAVEAHARQRKEQEERLLREKESQERAEIEERRRLAATGIKRFQERDLHKLEAKRQEKQAKEEEDAEQQKRLAKLKEKVEVHISRDPARLWKPTKGWEERTKEIGATGGGPVLQMFHRAVPSWRQGL